MRLSSFADYAVVLMSAAARHCGAAKMNATTLAGGGVRLSRPPATITLADVVEAVEGPIAMTACADTGTHDCTLEQDCRIRPHMNVANEAIRAALAGVTIASLTREMA